MSLPKTELGSQPFADCRDAGEITRDAFLDGRFTACQPKSGPRAAIDALFLAAAVPAETRKKQRVLEAGSGSGVASLALCARVADLHVTGVEIQSGLVEMARENAALNAMHERLQFVEADVTSPWSALERNGLKRESFDHVAANPPYYTSGTIREPAQPATARAHSFDQDDLERWIKFLTTAAAPGGTITLIHRPQVLSELLNLLEGRFGALRVFPLFPAEGSAANRVLVQGVKGSKAPLEVLRGMVLHMDGGAYTGEAEDVLRAGKGLKLTGS